MKVTIELDNGEILGFSEWRAIRWFECFKDTVNCEEQMEGHEEIKRELTEEQENALMAICQNIRDSDYYAEQIGDIESELYEDAINQLVEQFPELLEEEK